MKKIIYSLLTIVTFCCIQTANAELIIYTSMLTDNATCGKWVEERKINAAGNHISYLAGFLSGMSAISGKDFLKNIDSSAVNVWTDNFCKNNPTESLINAATSFMLEMISKKGL